MSLVNFSIVQPAVVIHCDVCGQRWVGADPDEDKETHEWMVKHAKWHEASPLSPPKDLILP